MTNTTSSRFRTHDSGMVTSIMSGTIAVLPAEVSTDDLAFMAREVRAPRTYGQRRVQADRKALAALALRQGMHPWTVANYAGLTEGYVRGLVKAADR